MTQIRIRHPAVAGVFYPAGRNELAREVDRLLAEAEAAEKAAADTEEEAEHPDGGPAPKAVIAPHAGYPYSGPVAATVFRHLRAARGSIRRVVVLGPSHRVPLRGLALPRSEVFATPLGRLRVDGEAASALAELPQVSVSDAPHAVEHSLEVLLPFLQRLLGEVTVVPLVVGDATPEEVSEVLETVWDGPETLVGVSTDLSHYLDHDAARRRDRRTAEAIEGLHFEDLGPGDACGCDAVRGLLHLARRRDLRIRCLDLRTSGDTAGPRDQVVGYGGFAVDESSSGSGFESGSR